MSQSPRFCEQCGAPLNPGARFCAQCGHAMPSAPAQAAAPPPPAARPAPAPAQQPAAAAPPEAPEAEPIIGVVPGVQRRKGLLGYETFNLVVTPERLVFALMTQQMINDAVRQAQEEAKRQGKGLLGRIAAQMGWLDIMSERYRTMPVEQALAENPNSFFIPNNQIRQVKAERRENRQQHTHSDHLIIEATSGKYEFELKSGSPEDVRELLARVLGAVVR